MEGVRRLNINLPEKTFNELQELADRSGRTMTDFMRTALGLAKVAIEESEKENRLAVTNKDGKLLKEILIPR